MTLTEALINHMNSQVEVHQITQYREGQLIEVGDSYLQILAQEPSYSTPAEQVTFPMQTVEFIRILT